MVKGQPDTDREGHPADGQAKEARENRRVDDPGQAAWRRFAEAKSPEEYYQSWLSLQCRLISDVLDGVLLLGDGETGPFAPAAYWPEGPRDRRHLAEVAEKALLERRGLIFKPEPSDDSARSLFHLAYPILIAGRLRGVVALALVPRPDPQLQGVMRQLQWGSAWLEVLFHRQNRSRELGAPDELRVALELIAGILEHKRFQAAASAFVTELATRTACDRVSVGFVRRGRNHLRAVSHSAHFGKKTNLARAIEAAMDEALDQEATVVYPIAPGAPFQITRTHEALARQHGAGAVCSVPLCREGRVFGLLTLERPPDVSFDPPTVEVVEAVAALSGPLLELQRREDRWWITKAGDALRGQIERLVGPRHLLRKLLAVALAAAVGFFTVARTDYRLVATTLLEPEIRRVVVAPFDGYIADAWVRAGDLVEAGQALCALDDRDLRLQRRKWLGQREQYSKQYQIAMAERNAAQVKISAAQIAQAEAELALVEDFLARAQVQAPFDGVVVSGDLRQSIGAPVERGQVLFEAAPLEVYRVILEVDERDIAQVTMGQRGHLLSSLPTEPLPFTVRLLTPVSTARQGRNYFRVEAQLEQADARLRPGMEGIGKIELGRRLLIWVWTHRAIDWARLFIWSWSP